MSTNGFVSSTHVPDLQPHTPPSLSWLVGEMEKKEIARKIRRIGDHLKMVQNCYVIALFNLTATETVNKRILTALKEFREHARMMLNDVDELIKELEHRV
jgi:phosphate uptake regulator